MAQEHHDYDGITEDRERRPPVYFTVLFYGLILWGVAYAAFYLLSGWSSQGEFATKMQAHEAKHQVSPPPSPAAPAAAPAATDSAPDARALYAGKCAACHGAAGEGGYGSSLTAPQYVYGKEPAAIAASIAAGRGGGKMPAFAGQLSEAEINALVDYILALK